MLFSWRLTTLRGATYTTLKNPGNRVLCRKHAPSPGTFCKLRGKYGGVELADAKRLKQFEDENAKLVVPRAS